MPGAKSNRNGNGADVGLEEKLWAAADKKKPLFSN